MVQRLLMVSQAGQGKAGQGRAGQGRAGQDLNQLDQLLPIGPRA